MQNLCLKLVVGGIIFAQKRLKNLFFVQYDVNKDVKLGN